MLSRKKTKFFLVVFICHIIGFAAVFVLRRCITAPSSPSLEIVSRSCLMMGGVVQFKVAVPSGQVIEANQAIERAQAKLQTFVDLVSSWNEQSDTSRINAAAGQAPVKVDARLLDVLLHARRISELSNGAFDVTTAAVSQLWQLREDDPVIPDDETLAEALRLVDYRELVLDEAVGTALLRQAGMRIDLGAIAKGAAIDVAVNSLVDDSFGNCLIEAGGDLRALGDKDGQPWTVGLRDPRGKRNEVLGKLSLNNEAVATSGDYEKMIELDGQRYHHILDPRTGRPANKCVSVTVIAPDAQTADALATAFFVMGPEAGLALCEQLPDVEALFVTPELELIPSSGFPPAALGK